MRATIKTIALSVVIALALTACNNAQKKQQTETAPVQETTIQTDYSGNYVSPDYEKRSEGYDWVAVTITNIDAGTIAVSVRSRADKKEPTCTFDTKAQKRDDNRYAADVKGKSILFTFDGSNISISAEKTEDSSVLYFYCSGGASLAGDYVKISEPLDEKQVDKTPKP